MAYNYKPFFSKISIQGKGQDELSYVFSNGPIEHKNSSVTLFGIFAVHSSQEIYRQFIKQTVKHFVDFYHRAVSLGDNSTESETGMNNEEFLFENAIQYVYDKVTTALIEFQDDHKRLGAIDLKKIHCILGVLTPDGLYLSSTGGLLRCFYIYPLKNKQGFPRYSLVPILDNERGSEHQTRLFSQIVSGAVSLPGGIVCISTASLLDYVSIEQLKQLVTTKQPEDIAESLQRMLSRVNARNDITALFIHPTYTGNAHAPGQYTLQTAANRSMEVLNSRQRGTDSVMTPATSLHISQALQNTKHSIAHYFKKIIALEKVLFQPANIKKLRSFFTYAVNIAKGTLKNVSQAMRFIHSSLASKSYRATIQSHISFAKKMYLGCLGGTASLKQTFLKLPRSSLIIFSLSILFILLFLISLFTLSAQKQQQQHFATIDVIIQALVDKSNTAEARIIFENDSATLPLIQEMQQLIDHIPSPRTHKQNISLVELKEKISSLEQRLSRTISISTPEHIAALTDIHSDSITDISEYAGTILIATDQNFYTLSPKNNNLLRIPLPPSLATSHCATATKDSVLICNGDGTRLYRVLHDGTQKIIPLSLSSQEGAIDKIQLYNSNAYAYSSRAATFFKHSSSGQGFGAGIKWVKDSKIPLNDLLDFDIDGSIYVLKNNNQLYQYVHGKPRAIPLPKILPAIKAITKIETDQLSQFLYLMEPTSNRIIVLDKKTLQFKAQLSSNVFTELKDIQLRPSSNSLLVINNTDLYGVSLEKVK